MLPFHLRPPRYGGKLKKRVAAEASFLERQHPLRDGGPVQRAIEADLSALFEEFKDKLHRLSTPEGERHHDIGTGFRAFKEVFNCAKVALLHTRLAPPRCDMGAYAQLIYASCFSMLRDAFRDKSGAFSFDRGAFPLFLLYALFETCPLPKSPNSVREQIESLPMLLQDRENVRGIFRRSYRTAIRIDQEHFSYLTRLRDLAHAATSRCEQSLLKCQRHRLPTGPLSPTEEETDTPIPWTCTCAVSLDVPEVISRLLPNLQFCAYTGPCCLEGLAGHSDYSFPPNSNSHAWLHRIRREVAEKAQNYVLHVAPTVVQPLAASANFSQSLLNQLDDYISKRGVIRLPPLVRNMNNQSRRVRNALLPMFSSSDSSDPLEVLRANGRELEPQAKRLKVVHFPTIVAHFGAATVAGGTTFSNAATSVEKPAEGATTDGDGVAYDLVLPPDLPAALEESVQAAFGTLLSRGPLLQLPPQLPPPPLHTALLATDTGDVSTLGETRGVSTVASVSTAVGRNALRELLRKAKGGTHDDHGSSRASGVSRNAHDDARQAVPKDPQQVRERGELFLESDRLDGEEEQAMATKDGDISDLSSDEEAAGAGSVTQSTVGRAALRDLISLATTSRVPTKHGSKKRARPSRKQRADKRTRKSPFRNGQALFDDTSSAGAQGLGSVTNSTVGRAALQNLLSLVSASTKAPSKRRPRQPPRRKTRREKAENGADDDSSKQISDEEQTQVSATNSTVGRSALQNLISRATSTSPSASGPRRRSARLRNTTQQVPKKNELDHRHDEQSQVSTTSSTVGQSALRDLLSRSAKPIRNTTSLRKGPRRANVSRKGAEIQKTNGPSDEGQDHETEPTDSPATTTERKGAQQTGNDAESGSENSASPNSDDNESMPSTSSSDTTTQNRGEGRTALEELLARAMC